MKSDKKIKKPLLGLLLATACILCACGQESEPVSAEPGETKIRSNDDISTASADTSSSSSGSRSAEVSAPSSSGDPSSSPASSEAGTKIATAESTSENSTIATAESTSAAEQTASKASNQAPSQPSSQASASPQTSAQTSEAAAPDRSTPSGQLSALHVDGTYLVNEAGEHIQLYGMSTHGLSFFPEYVNYDTFQTLHDDWKINCIRLAMYTAEYNGYCTGGNKETLKNLIRNGVQYATDLNMYVIVDWHILSDQDPNVYKQDAKDFFSQMSAEFADHTNVLYEICNEPNGYATWDSVKAYAEEVIPCIRANDEDAVILVGSPTWSQDIDKALANPLNFDNVMYTLHFYAGTHKDDLRNRLENCVTSGLPVFVSEFGMCDASGNGGNDFDSAQKWLDLINKYDISFMCWNLANKNESSSVIREGVSALSGWSENELSESGKWIRNVFRGKNE